MYKIVTRDPSALSLFLPNHSNLFLTEKSAWECLDIEQKLTDIDVYRQMFRVMSLKSELFAIAKRTIEQTEFNTLSVFSNFEDCVRACTKIYAELSNTDYFFVPERLTQVFYISYKENRMDNRFLSYGLFTSRILAQNKANELGMNLQVQQLKINL